MSSTVREYFRNLCGMYVAVEVSKDCVLKKKADYEFCL